MLESPTRGGILGETYHLVLDGGSLTPAEVERAVLAPGLSVVLAPSAREACLRSRSALERMVEGGAAVYGVNTGFGDLARVRIPDQDLERLQTNLVRSHAAGVGRPMAAEVVRGAMLLRANTLAKGASGVRPELIDTLLALLAGRVVPVVPEYGSLGASGDLAPLAHIALLVLGEGEAWYRGELLPGAEALARAGISPMRLAAKEGLALTNGTPVMTSLGCLAICRATRLLATAGLAGAMSTEALRGSDGPFRPEIAELRGHPGHREAASMLRAFMHGSEVRASHATCTKVQDPYSLRCFPQVLGAAIDAVRWIHGVLSIECNAATDNPLVVGDQVATGGNFHGAPVGYPLDLLAIVMTDLASIAERRTFRLLTQFLSELPPFLTRQSGLNSGLMIAQYTQAALVSQGKLQSHPASVDSIPSSADQEDHVSMAAHAAQKAMVAVELAEKAVAIELLVAAQGLEFHLPLRAGSAVEAARERIRREVPPLAEDRVLAGDMARVEAMVTSGEMSGIARSAAWENGWLGSILDQG